MARALKIPGAPVDAPAADTDDDAAAEMAELQATEESAADDPRTPGLTVNDDGSITYDGVTHRRPFKTEHGVVVPPCSFEPTGTKK
jgi:hypothetical protein